MPTAATEITLRGVSKKFRSFRGEVEVLKTLDLTITPGEFFVLLGPSGCGKSTTLNLIAGLEKPTSGAILFAGKAVADSGNGIFLPPFERDISFVFQSYALYPHMTIEKNIEFPLTNLKTKLSKQERLSRVKQVASTLKIENLLDRKPSELSGGQRQRVAIGRAIVRNPALFLMDEPLSNLDAKLRAEMRAELKALQRKLGITTVYVTHDQVEAMTLGDRIAVLEGGYIQQLGTPEEVYNRPSNTFVAKFIGSPPMNLLEGSIDKNDQGITFTASNLSIRIREPLSTRLEPLAGKKLLLGIRPEAASITEEDPDMVLDFDLAENIGHECLLHAFIDNSAFIIINRTTPSNLKALKIKLEMDRLYFFDATRRELLIFD